jgi:hypothetical protein
MSYLPFLYCLIEISIYQYIFLRIFIAVLGEILIPKETLVRNVGQDAKIMFNTTHGNSILAAKFGLDGGKDYPDPKLITVIDKNGTEKPYYSDLDNPVAASYKERVSFFGNLKKGHAWFLIQNLTINDTNQYQANIREDSSGDYGKKITVNLIVKEGKLNAVSNQFPCVHLPRFCDFCQMILTLRKYTYVGSCMGSSKMSKVLLKFMIVSKVHCLSSLPKSRSH